ncbi:MAG TPA: nuclear transport factor 2 family protein [Alphaproteobacteria bacterium]|jgi:steroid delta-isomerase|nr:nuclear transport factor 2 family protein [Alphaproteobacteria bacterium]
MSSSDQTKTQAIETFLASYKIKDVATRIALFADGISFEDPVGSPPIVGKAAMNEYFVATVASGWDIDLVPKKIMVNGTEAASITEVTASVGGNPPVTSTIVQIFAFDDAGKFKTLRVFMDTPPG